MTRSDVFIEHYEGVSSIEIGSYNEDLCDILDTVNEDGLEGIWDKSPAQIFAAAAREHRKPKAILGWIQAEARGSGRIKDPKVKKDRAEKVKAVFGLLKDAVAKHKAKTAASAQPTSKVTKHVGLARGQSTAGLSKLKSDSSNKHQENIDKEVYRSAGQESGYNASKMWSKDDISSHDQIADVTKILKKAGVHDDPKKLADHIEKVVGNPHGDKKGKSLYGAWSHTNRIATKVANLAKHATGDKKKELESLHTTLRDASKLLAKKGEDIDPMMWIFDDDEDKKRYEKDVDDAERVKGHDDYVKSYRRR